MAAYYNEFEPFAAAWLRELIKEGVIADGEVDTRSIADVTGADLAGFTQCHFFAGIGGWSYALRLAGWPDDRPVWTGSCPCQPFSVAGKRKGKEDARDIWPLFGRLITERRPAIVFGEQVASQAGRIWFSGIRTDLEALGYSVGAADLSAAGVSAPHIRQRLYWMANAQRVGLRSERPEAALGASGGMQGENGQWERLRSDAGSADLLDAGLADTRGAGSFPSSQAGVHRSEDGRGSRDVEPERCGSDQIDGLGDTDRYQRHWWSGPVQMGRNGIEGEIERGGRRYRAQWRVGPGISIVAHGIPNRVGTLRGAGNAIVPQVAAEFIQAADEAMTSLQPTF